MNRDQMIQQMEDARSELWDLVIIGGGATGLGSALDAATRGLRVLLLEKNDFASGTSSRSTKLIHGGVRYLRQGNVKLVRESLRERGLLMRNASGLVDSLQFVVPSCGRFDSLYYGVGLKVYDLLAGSLNIDSSRHLTKEEMLNAMPGISDKGIRGGTLYFDAQFDDARLAIAIARTAVARGAVVVNYMKAASFRKGSGSTISSVIARDEENGAEHEIRTRAVINAAGPFVDDVIGMEGSTKTKMITPSRGSHLVIDGSYLPGGKALMVPKTDDGRVLFLIPWHGSVLVGTTDVSCENIDPDPIPSHEEIAYLLEHAGRYLERAPHAEDVRSMFAGLRPLVSTKRADGARSTSTISRDHVISTSAGGMVTVTGGKWTTYRKMAEDAVDVAMAVAGITGRNCDTDNVVLESGSREVGSGEQLHPNLPYRMSDLDKGISEEMARNLEDLLARRTRCLFLNAAASHSIAPVVAGRLGAALGKGSSWVENEVGAFRAQAARYLPTEIGGSGGLSVEDEGIPSSPIEPIID